MRGWSQRLREHPAIGGEYGFAPILILILVSLSFQMAAPEADWARFVTVALQGVTGLVWVHPNSGETGYYRWRVPPVTLTVLAAVLYTLRPSPVAEVPAIRARSVGEPTSSTLSSPGWRAWRAST